MRTILIFISSALFIMLSLSGCVDKEKVVSTTKSNFLVTNESLGFAGSLAPNENRAPDRLDATPKVPSIEKLLKQSNTPSDPFTPLLSLRSLESGMTLIVNFAQRDETFNWNIREVKSFEPNLIKNIQRVDDFKYLEFEYIQFVSSNDIDMCLAIQESGFFGLKNCADDLEKAKFESVFQLIPMSTDSVQIRSLVLGGGECISTFENPELFPWQLIGIDKCQLMQGFNTNLARLWAIMPENRPAKVLVSVK